MQKPMNLDGVHKCAHEQCECQIPILQEYCSDYCSDADDVAEVVLACSCGHTPCAYHGMDA